MSITCFVLQSLRRRECPNIAPCPCTLLIYCHFHLYQAVATLFRCHLSEALGATRVAIEAGLHVYRFLEGHGTPEEYVQGEPTFKYTVNHIRQARIKLADKFPLAERLIALHELCSRFGSHADFDSFLHRIEFTAGDVATTKLLYFQKPDSIADFQFYAVAVLHTFILILNVFEPLVMELRLVDSSWGDDLRRTGAGLENMREQLKEPQATEAAKPSDSA
jgi:hypothetical protein